MLKSGRPVRWCSAVGEGNAQVWKVSEVVQCCGTGNVQVWKVSEVVQCCGQIMLKSRR